MLPASFEEVNKSDGIVGLELFWIAFWELRSSTAPDLPIPFSEREVWARAHGLDYDTRERLHEILSSMDAEYRKWRAQREEQSDKRTATKQRKSRRGRTP